MKRVILFLFFASVLFSAGGCDEAENKEPSAPAAVYLRNLSGHKVTIRHTSCKELPDDFVLQDGEEYNLTGKVVNPEALSFWDADLTFYFILYDDRWALFPDMLPPDRNFRDQSVFTFEEPSAYRFDFTKDDYEYILRNGDDLTEEPGEPVFAPYELRNLSGHVISIVHRPKHYYFPDSLVLKNGDVHQFDGEDTFFYGDFESQLIYYDGRYVMPIRNLPVGYGCCRKDEFVFTNQTEAGEHYRGACVYRFTERDYAYAAGHGTDLGAPELK